jgi:hypothetical protein
MEVDGIRKPHVEPAGQSQFVPDADLEDAEVDKDNCAGVLLREEMRVGVQDPHLAEFGLHDPSSRTIESVSRGRAA